MSLIIFFTNGSLQALRVLSLFLDEMHLVYTDYSTSKSVRVDCLNVDHIVVDGVEIDPVRL